MKTSGSTGSFPARGDTSPPGGSLSPAASRQVVCEPEHAILA